MISKKSTFLYSTILITILLSGCATIFNGTHQDVSINTTPQGIKAKIGEDSCITPCTLHVWRRSDKILFQEGATETQYDLIKGDNAWSFYAGNFVSWFFVGWVADGISGGRFNIEPVNIILLKSKRGGNSTIGNAQ
ncbi:MAG: hypothetical protein WC539_07410 [Nitrospirota bacterium]